MPKFLVIDDSPLVRSLVAIALGRLDEAEVVEAGDGVDALRKMLAERFDLILADINMPLMDGLKLVYLVRKSPAMQNVPIVFITTEGAAVDRERGMALGADAYLSKPIYGPKLREVVTELLQKYSRGRENGQAQEKGQAQ